MKLNKNTKKAQGILEWYNFSIGRYGVMSIFEAYKKPSSEKIRTWKAIERMCNNMNGHGLTVLGRGLHFYSAAFIANEDGKDKLFYFTAYNTYEIEI